MKVAWPEERLHYIEMYTTDHATVSVVRLFGNVVTSFDGSIRCFQRLEDTREDIQAAPRLFSLHGVWRIQSDYNFSLNLNARWF